MAGGGKKLAVENISLHKYLHQYLQVRPPSHHQYQGWRALSSLHITPGLLLLLLQCTIGINGLAISGGTFFAASLMERLKYDARGYTVCPGSNEPFNIASLL